MIVRQIKGGVPVKLFTFFRSGSAYRVRIALAIKGIEYEPVYVVIGGDSTDLSDPEYLALNPSGVVPTLVDGDAVLHQTMAIIEYLEETHPDPPLLPKDAAERARVRALAQVMVSDTHPLNTIRVVGYLDEKLRIPKEGREQWLRHWNERGLGIVEKTLSDGGYGGGYCLGDRPTVADIYVATQVYLANRFGADLSGLKNVKRVYDACMEHPAFAETHPAKQPDNPDNR